MSKKHERVFWVSVASIILALPAIAFVSARTKPKASVTAKNPAVKSATVKELGQSSRALTRQRIEGEIIAITPNGFIPATIIRPAGAFLLVVDNQSGLPAITLLLLPDVGFPLRNVLVPREKRHWSDIVDLPPGNYTVREATHPRWICQITIR